jgi:hypothetical protein
MSHRSGTTSGGQRINVRGTDFTGVRAVYFGAARATAVRVISSTELALTAPAHAAGTVSVRVSTTHGLSSIRSTYRYVRPPTVTGVSPGSGPAAGGTAVTITGTDFTNVVSVWFGHRRAAGFRVLSTTRVRAVAPAGTPGSVPVSVHTWYGFAPGRVTFTYSAPPSTTPPTSSAAPAPQRAGASPPAPASPPVVPAAATPSGTVTPPR